MSRTVADEVVTVREKFSTAMPIVRPVYVDPRSGDAMAILETPVDVLRAEHASTRRMLRVLVELATRVGDGEPFPAADVASALTYFREFVELVHHGKESAVLYPFAAMHGGDDAAEAAGELIADHDESKLLLHSLTVFWEPDGLRDDERRAFARLVHTYAERLTRHMEMEERTLFPVAAQLPGDERLRLLEEFDTIAARHRPHATWEAELRRLEAAYLAD